MSDDVYRVSGFGIRFRRWFSGALRGRGKGGRGEEARDARRETRVRNCAKENSRSHFHLAVSSFCFFLVLSFLPFFNRAAAIRGSDYISIAR